jgi:hypothetical protein
MAWMDQNMLWTMPPLPNPSFYLSLFHFVTCEGNSFALYTHDMDCNL